MTNDTTRERLNHLAQQLEPLAQHAYTLTLLWYAVRCFQEGYDDNPDIVQIADREIHTVADFIDAHFNELSYDHYDIFGEIFGLMALSGRLKDVSKKPISIPSALIPTADVAKFHECLCDIQGALSKAFVAANNLLQITELNELKEAED
jgi:hypothetical protein